MFFTNTNKEVIMKNNQEKAAMTAAEKLGEALVLKPEWEVKPKSVVMTHVFSVEFNESTKELQLEVNGDVYQTLKCKDILNGKIKFHNGLNEIINKFNLWKYDEPKINN
tara:strand:+ start:415 stop:741 length:327 start_codon:yes stop_codon:yes gene_type:complete